MYVNTYKLSEIRFTVAEVLWINTVLLHSQSFGLIAPEDIIQEIIQKIEKEINGINNRNNINY